MTRRPKTGRGLAEMPLVNLPAFAPDLTAEDAFEGDACGIDDRDVDAQRPRGCGHLGADPVPEDRHLHPRAHVHRGG